MGNYKYLKYPIRVNYLATTYCEIAMESWYEMDKLFQIVKKSGYSWYDRPNVKAMHKKGIEVVVFSAMCLESFLNNFAASAMGDDEFYENFDRLSPIGKLQLVARLILDVEIDKSQSMYCRFKTLFRLRDQYVHNKSRKAVIPETSDGVLQSGEKYIETSDSPDKMSHAAVEDIKTIYQDALNALSAVKEIAEWFDKHDAPIDAVSLLFFPSTVLYNDPASVYKRKVFSALGIKVE